MFSKKCMKETCKNCVQTIFLYLLWHMFYYSSILYLVFIANTVMSVLQVYRVVPIWSSSYKAEGAMQNMHNQIVVI